MNKIQLRKSLKNDYIIPLYEHESYTKESLFKNKKMDFCFFKKPDFDLKMVLQVRKDKQFKITLTELETLLKNQVEI